MTNKEKEKYFDSKARLFAKTANLLIAVFMTKKKSYKEREHFKFWLIFMGLQETAYIIEEADD